MPGIFVDQMRCKSSTDDADDIYMMVFRGNTTAPFSTNVVAIGPGNFWDDFDSADVWNQDIPVAKFHRDAEYVVMLVEQDSGKDIDRQALGLWRSMTDVAWKAVMISQTLAGLPPTEAQRKGAVAAISNTFLGAAEATIRVPKDPDDVIGVPTRLVVSPEHPATLEFKETSDQGGSGHYKVTFKVK